MATLRINDFEILVDDEDQDLFIKYDWKVFKTKRTNYLRAKILNKRVFLHRYLLNVTDSKMFVDHINHNGLDNRKLNLRISDCRTNQQNKIKSANKSSKFKGVRYNKSMKRIKRWDAQIRHDNKNIFLGSFRTEQEAAQAYNNAAIKYFGEFAYINILEGESNVKT